MDERNRIPTTPRPVVSAGPSMYLLEMKNAEGVSEFIPIQLLVGEAGVQCTQPYNLELAPMSTTNEPTTNINVPYTAVVNYPTIDQHLPKDDLEKQINISSIEGRKIPELDERISERTNKNKSKYVQKGESNHVQNNLQKYVHIADRVVPPRAIAVLPTSLRFRRDHIYPIRALPPRVRFGPVQGIITKIFPCEADDLTSECALNEKPIFLMNRDQESVTHINVSDKDKANWLSLLPLGNDSTANVWLYEEEDKIFGITTKVIPSRTQLSLGYSKKYAEKNKLPTGQPILNLDEALTDDSNWWCYECNRALESAPMLLRHMNVYHKDVKHSRRKYRCSNCCKTFCKVFTLRRHAKFCTKKPVKSIEIEIDRNKKDPNFSTAQTTEDNRIPSDESFQNYTSVLDFSTNLFDPDRISNLDISGNKSDAGFDLHSENFIEEEYSKFCKGLKFDNDEKCSAQKEELITSCPHCEKSLNGFAKRRHLRECPARRLACKCGKLFTRKDVFAKHVRLCQKSPQKIINESFPYKCGSCSMKFKRRGMLVNHLWRIHNKSSAAVPLERYIRYYPCSVCPKLYRTAAKRDRHVKNHHPGTGIRAAPIQGERRSYQPAKCSFCPREYGTRSKLLQHIRCSHPDLSVSAKSDPQRLDSTRKNKPPIERRSTNKP